MIIDKSVDDNHLHKMYILFLTTILFITSITAYDNRITNENASEGYSNEESLSAVDVVQNIYKECVAHGSFTCVKPKVLAFLSASTNKDKIRLTRDLTIIRTSPALDSQIKIPKVSELVGEDKEKMKLFALDKMDDFLSNHELKIRIPKELTTEELPPYVPQILTKNLPKEITVPLVGATNEGRSKKFMKRVVMPFLLGLKFKATTLIPLAFALIALKTWKALTLGLLSIVLSGAMVIFKFSKPKVNYEVIHYPQPVPVYESYPPHHHEYPHHAAHGRQFDPHKLAYSSSIHS